MTGLGANGAEAATAARQSRAGRGRVPPRKFPDASADARRCSTCLQMARQVCLCPAGA